MTLPHKTESEIHALLERTTYSASMWPFIVDPTQRHLELYIDDAIFAALAALTPLDFSVDEMLRAYFAPRAANIFLRIDDNILIFDKDHRDILRTYHHPPPAFLRGLKIVFGISVALVLVGTICFFARLLVDSAALDAVLVTALFLFLLNATAGLSLFLLGCHRPRRNIMMLRELPRIERVEIL